MVFKKSFKSLRDSRELIDPAEITFKKFESHPSVFNIKDNIKASHFSFSEIVLVETELKNLKSDKASTIFQLSN